MSDEQIKGLYVEPCLSLFAPLFVIYYKSDMTSAG